MLVATTSPPTSNGGVLRYQLRAGVGAYWGELRTLRGSMPRLRHQQPWIGCLPTMDVNSHRVDSQVEGCKRSIARFNHLL